MKFSHNFGLALSNRFQIHTIIVGQNTYEMGAVLPVYLLCWLNKTQCVLLPHRSSCPTLLYVFRRRRQGRGNFVSRLKVCQRSSRIRQIRSEMKIKNIVIDFVWLDPALGWLGVTERWLLQPFTFEGSRFFRSLECWFYWFALYKMIFSQNVQIHFSRAD